MDIAALQRITQDLAATSPVLPPEKLAERRELIQAVKALNAADLFGQESELLFQMDRESHRFVIRMVDRRTGEVVEQVPPEYVLRLARELRAQQE